MKKKNFLVYIIAAAMILSLGGCRAELKETEASTSSEAVSETAKETETEKETTKQTETQKATEKASSTGTSSSKNTSSKDKSTSTEKTTVKPSTLSNKNKQSTESSDSSAGTRMCPYCYQQISLASDGAGSTIYADHVAQEKAWSDYVNSTDSTQTTPSTDASTPGSSSASSDTAQCPYCYQYFTVSDGSYSAHLSSENSKLGLPDGSDYVTCPLCGNTYRRGIEYDTHYCTGINHD